MGELEAENGNYAEAIESIKSSFGIWNSLYAEHKDIHSLLAMVKCQMRAAEIYKLKEDLTNGLYVLSQIKKQVDESAYHNAVALRKSLACADIITADFLMQEKGMMRHILCTCIPLTSLLLMRINLWQPMI